MTNKFTIGSQWLTKGGWRAVVVAVVNDEELNVWHEVDNETLFHNVDGSVPAQDTAFALDKPYTEPRKGTVWVNVWQHKEDGDIVSLSFDSEEARKEDEEDAEIFKLIAYFKHDWVENEKI